MNLSLGSIYNSPQQLADLLSKGSANGGIAAAFDEIPFMKLFISQHCSKYTMVQPTYKFDGFGFVSALSSHKQTFVSNIKYISAPF